MASTGVIGVNLPMNKLKAGIPQAFAALAIDGGSQAAQAIMTTDPFPKEAAATFVVGGKTVTVGGMAKGSGMIGPNMAAVDATMLAFVTTDAAVAQPLLQRALVEVVDETFNAITVDGDTSTNDTVMLLANGASGVTVGDAEYAPFVKALHAVCLELALGIVRGGEGATKLVTVTVSGAASSAEARRRRRPSRPPCSSRPPSTAAIPTGAGCSRSPAAPAWHSTRTRAKVTIGSIVFLRTAGRMMTAPPQAAEYLKSTDIAVGVDLGAGAARRRCGRAICRPSTCKSTPTTERRDASDNEKISSRSSISTPPISSGACSSPRG